MRNLVNLMGEKSILDTSALSVFDQWHQSLAQMGYNFAEFQNHNPELCLANEIFLHPVDYDKMPVDSPTGLIPILNLDEINKILNKTCDYENTNNLKKVSLSQPWMQYPNVLLLVVFNHPNYESIPYVETLYRPFFPHILYCGPIPLDMNAPALQKLKLSFVQYNLSPMGKGQLPGSNNYECMVNALQMKYPVDGILFLADDVLLAPGKIKNFQTMVAWYVPRWDTINDDVRDPIIRQWGFLKQGYQLMHFWSRTEQGKNNSPVLQKCFQNLITRNGDKFRFNGGFADLYYIPQRIGPEFAFLGSLFQENYAYLEMAVPTIIQCLDGLDNVEILDGEYRNQHRDEPWHKFADPKFKGRSYLHRTKWSHLATELKPKNYHKFFCTKALPWLHDPNGTLPV